MEAVEDLASFRDLGILPHGQGVGLQWPRAVLVLAHLIPLLALIRLPADVGLGSQGVVQKILVHYLPFLSKTLTAILWELQ